MFCTKCGRKLVDGREICSVCGAVNKTVTNALWPQLEELLSQKMVAIVAWILTAVLAVGNVCTWIPSGLSLGASHRTAMSTTKDFVAALCEGDSKRMISCCIVEYGMVGGLLGTTPAMLTEVSTQYFQNRKASEIKYTAYQDNYVFVQTDNYLIAIYCTKVDGEYLIYEIHMTKVDENSDVLQTFKYYSAPTGGYWNEIMEAAGIEFN
ncbi:MAG: hypothetical protein ACI4XW_05795 [Candidatus Spyradocola sp.]